MHRNPPVLALVCFFALAAGQQGCTPTNEPDPLEALDASFSCTDDGSGPVWAFAIGVSGPASDSRTRVFIETEALQNELGYPMELDGAAGDSRRDFSVDVPGTADGDVPGPSDVPFSCIDEGTVDVRFCVENRSLLEDVCWQCGEGSTAELPNDVDAWLACG